MKRVVSLQDLSCIGKCSQTVALPVLSVMGIECVALPTALLSAHTAFPDFFVRDLTDCIAPIAAHWKSLDLRFDTIYTGYLSSEAQICLAEHLFDEYPDALRVVDPVMADFGRLYTGFSADFPEKMRALCRRANVITPNVTEACLLTGLPYREHLTRDEVHALLEALLALGTDTAILTGVALEEGMATAVMERGGAPILHTTEHIGGVFHGTGDLFSGVCVGALTLGLPAARAVRLAADHVVKTLRLTVQDPKRRWYGVNFEQTLPLLAEIGKEFSR